MKKIKALLVLSLMVGFLTTKAQTNEDSLAIETACRDYVEGWAEGNIERVSKAVSPELLKRKTKIKIKSLRLRIFSSPRPLSSPRPSIKFSTSNRPGERQKKRRKK